MPARTKSSTTRLPQTLREELEGVSGAYINQQKVGMEHNPISGNDHPRTKNPCRPKVSRREARKEQRQSRKKNKAKYFSANAYNKRHAEEEHHESPQRKKAKLDQPDNAPKHGPKPTSESKAFKVKDKSVEKVHKPVAPRIQGLRKHEDDAYITYLEAKLGYTKGAKRKKPAEDDGLDGKP
ncbi:hypothetical protein C0993_000111 [Termitomyces sp. T159_Od127]|nr:hypothetical protein C0993_000111 [Termitomyces sp. T159_Od127]